MTWSDVISFPAVDATAAVKAAWIAAAEADGDWWDTGLEVPRLEVAGGEPSPGQVLAALAACRVPEAALPDADVDTAAAVPPYVVLAGAAGIDTAAAVRPDVYGVVGEPAGVAANVAGATGAVDAAGPEWIDPEPGPAPDGLGRWVRAEWWSAPIRAQVRALMVLAPGPGLVAGLSAIGRQPACPAFHGHPDPVVEAADPVPAPGSTPGWPCACQVIVAAGWQAVIGWAETCADAAVVDLCGPDPVQVTPAGFARARVSDPARVEVAAALRVSPASACGRVSTARELHAHPALVQAAADGTVFSASRRAMLGATVNLPAPARARVINHVVAAARARHTHHRRPWTPSETREAVKHAVQVLAADEAGQARQQARKGRRVTLTPDCDGMAWLGAYLSDVDAHRIYRRLTAAAAAAKTDDPHDERTADQRRADLLTALLLGQHHHSDARSDSDNGGGGEWCPAPTDTGRCGEDGSRSGDGGEGGDGGHDGRDGGSHSDDAGRGEGRGHDAPGGTGPIPLPGRPDINVVVTLATLLGLRHDPAHVPGLGPIPADVARQLAADGRWRLWITDPTTGHVTTTGSRSYTPSAGLARLIRAREPHCRMPGCARQAVTCDLDHTVPYPADPGTVPSNLGPLCRGHHNLKTHHGYHLDTLPPDPGPGTEPGTNTPDHGTTLSWRWTFPSGLTHTDQPDPPLPGP